MSYPPRLALPTKPVFTLAIVAAPPTSEVFPNSTNFHWITVRVLIVTLFKRDPARPADLPAPATHRRLHRTFQHDACAVVFIPGAASTDDRLMG